MRGRLGAPFHSSAMSPASQDAVVLVSYTIQKRAGPRQAKQFYLVGRCNRFTVPSFRPSPVRGVSTSPTSFRRGPEPVNVRVTASAGRMRPTLHRLLDSGSVLQGARLCSVMTRQPTVLFTNRQRVDGGYRLRLVIRRRRRSGGCPTGGQTESVFGRGKAASPAGEWCPR
jgi:hypothetical protein